MTGEPAHRPSRSARAASAAHTVRRCTVQRVGVVSLDGSAGASPAGGGGSAQVLVFARLDVTDVESPTVPRSQAVTLGAPLQLSDGAWLISDMSDVAAAAPTTRVPPGTPDLVAATQTGVGAAVESAEVDLVTWLVAVHTSHVTTGGTQTALPDTPFEVTVTRSAAGSWQVSSLVTVGLS